MLDPLGGLLGHLLVLELLLDLPDLVVEIVLRSHLLLDGPHLLVQIVLLLALLHLLLDAGLDALIHAEDLGLHLDQAQEQRQALGQIEDVEQALLVIQLEGEVRGHRVGHLGGIRDGGDAGDQFLGDAAVQAGVFLEGLDNGAHEGGRFRRRQVVFDDALELDPEKFLFRDEPDDPRTAFALHQGFDGAIGQPQKLEHLADGAHLADVLFARVVDAGFLLGGQKYGLVAVHGLGQGVDGPGPAHEQRRHHERKHHDVPERQQRQHETGGGGLAVLIKLRNVHHMSHQLKSSKLEAKG